MTTTTTIFLKSESPLSPLRPHSPIMQHTPQSLAEAEAEAEAEVEVFRRQAYAIRGLVYPGPKSVYSRGNTLLPVHKRPSLSKVSSLPSTKRSKNLGAGQGVCVGTAPTPAPAEDTLSSQQPSFARLVENLLRTHSSTASPYGQHLSNEILSGNNNVYLGCFYPIPSSSSSSSSLSSED